MTSTAGIKFNYVVFDSGGEVNAALLGGHVEPASTNPGEALELYKAGKVRILGVLSEKRRAGALEIPTMKEQGIDALFIRNRGLAAPADIPPAARRVREEALFKYSKTETFKKYCRDNMLSEAWMDGPSVGRFLDDWKARYGEMRTEVGLIKKN